MKHIYEIHENCEIHNCIICDGGLKICTVCNGAEATLPAECPGTKMTEEQQNKIQAGEIDYLSDRWVIIAKRYYFKVSQGLPWCGQA
jgi:hypothetical protein